MSRSMGDIRDEERRLAVHGLYARSFTGVSWSFLPVFEIDRWLLHLGSFHRSYFTCLFFPYTSSTVVLVRQGCSQESAF
ncbi:hypothetical protein HYQ46_002336 [Verticillium longisporum]|nr:hypothetical protein HYQ46_002336 [Verticillium longisporum]